MPVSYMQQNPKVTLYFWLLQTALQILEEHWQEEAHTSCRQVVFLCRQHCFTLLQLLYKLLTGLPQLMLTVTLLMLPASI